MQDMTNEAGTGEQDVSQLTTTVLAARLPAASPWMPRREMEELLRRGPDAAPPLIDVLRRAQGRGDPLWPIVVLGELHRDDAIPALGLFLGRLEGGVNVAAAEALGKIGPPALPYLVATAAGEDPGRRLAASGALAGARARVALPAPRARPPRPGPPPAPARAPAPRAAPSRSRSSTRSPTSPPAARAAPAGAAAACTGVRPGSASAGTPPRPWSSSRPRASTAGSPPASPTSGRRSTTATPPSCESHGAAAPRCSATSSRWAAPPFSGWSPFAAKTSISACKDSASSAMICPIPLATARHCRTAFP